MTFGILPRKKMEKRQLSRGQAPLGLNFAGEGWLALIPTPSQLCSPS